MKYILAVAEIFISLIMRSLSNQHGKNMDRNWTVADETDLSSTVSCSASHESSVAFSKSIVLETRVRIVPTALHPHVPSVRKLEMSRAAPLFLKLRHSPTSHSSAAAATGNRQAIIVKPIQAVYMSCKRH